MTLVRVRRGPGSGFSQADNYPGLDRRVSVTTSCGFWADFSWDLAVGLCEAVQCSSFYDEHVGIGMIPDRLPVH